MASGPDGGVVVIGDVVGRVLEGFVWRLNAEGIEQWRHRFRAFEASVTPEAVEVQQSGSAVIGGDGSGPVDLGDGRRGGDHPFAFVVSLDADGALQWTRFFERTDEDDVDVLDVASATSETVLVTGRFKGTMDFGGGPRESEGAYDGFVVALDASDGQPLWDVTIGGPGEDYVTSVDGDADGNAIVTGVFHGTARAGSVTLSSRGGSDVFVAKHRP